MMSKGKCLDCPEGYPAACPLPDLQEAADKLASALAELMDLMDEVREGDYKPDSLTNQPGRIALADYRGTERGD
jgi:hypothetical protein